MNWLDILIIITFVASVIGGLATGIIRAVTALIGLILAIVLAGRYYGAAAGWLGFISNQDIANLIGFVFILISVMVISYILGSILRVVAKTIMLGWLDRLLGGVAGFLIAFLSWSVILALWVKFLGGSLAADSVLTGILLDKFPVILALLPAQFDIVREFFN
jgi:membrane protein required for colicin V production